MIRVEVVQTFSDGGQHYVAGELRYVSAAKAEYFCNAGWCRCPDFKTGGQPSPEVTLSIHDGHHAFSDQFSGVSNG